MKKILMWFGITLGSLIILLFIALTILNFLPGSIQKRVSQKSEQLLGIKNVQTLESDNQKPPANQKTAASTTGKPSAGTTAATASEPVETAGNSDSKADLKLDIDVNNLGTYSAMLDPLTDGKIMRDYQNFIAQVVDGPLIEAESTLNDVKSYLSPLLAVTIPRGDQYQKNWEELNTVIQSLLASMEDAYKYAKVNDIPSVLNQTQLISKYALDANTKADQLQRLHKVQ